MKTLRLIFMLAAIVLNAAPAYTQRRNSTSRHLKVTHAGSEAHHTSADTVTAGDGMVRFVGYDKALRSTKETLFVTNLMPDREIRHVIFRITYFDTQGRQLHQARKKLYAPVPPGETRRLDFPSWDRQHSFYYAKSQKPRVPAIPYTVKITPDTLILAR